MLTSKEAVEEFSKKTVFELKAYAKKNNIDIVGSNTKNELLEAILPFVPRQDEVIEEVVEQVEEIKEEVKTPKKVDILKDKVAVFSNGNIHWNGVGSLEKGYNIVTKEASVKWLTKKSVREATPQEVAAYYGKY
jgi:hypothetical protein